MSPIFINTSSYACPTVSAFGSSPWSSPLDFAKLVMLPVAVFITALYPLYFAFIVLPLAFAVAELSSFFSSVCNADTF